MDDAYPSPGQGMPFIAKPGLPTSFAFSRQMEYMSSTSLQITPDNRFYEAARGHLSSPSPEANTCLHLSILCIFTSRW